MQMETLNEVELKGKAAKTASFKLINKTTQQKNDALLAIANSIHNAQSEILSANQLDVADSRNKGIPESTIDRILLTEERIATICEAIEQLVTLPDPIGETLEEIHKENDLIIHKKRVPLGVIGMIYEARPNVTVDAATLALKTNNAVILRGSSSAINSNKAIVRAIQSALEMVEFPKEAVQLIEDTSRETAKALFTLNDYLDVLIPRGGKALIDLVVRESSVPVLETGAGNCHIYIDQTADFSKTLPIVLNAKTQRPSVCNACESLILHESFLQKYGTQLFEALALADVELFGDESSKAFHSSIQLASDDHYYEEFLRKALSIKTVTSVDEAIAHIQKYGTKHSEAILTEDEKMAEKFLHEVDAACVYHNASTRFTDGFEFGYGAEIGISTQKLHARGPMGLTALTSSKYIIQGNGQIRN